VRFISTSDGSCIAFHDSLTVEQLQRQVDVLIETQVDTLCYTIGLPGAYEYDTKVGTRFGQGIEKMGNATDWQVKENLESLLRQGTDPFRVVLERGLEKGLKVYPDIRVYDCQTGIDLDPMNRAHPQWRIGEHARHGPAALLYGERVTKEYHNENYTWQLDFAHPQVRQRTIDIAEEILTRYEVEGLQLDFERRPHFFRPDAAVENRHLMTDMLRAIRHRARHAEGKRDRPVEVLCRVWANLEDCWHLGLDVRTWVEEGLIDLIIPTHHICFAIDAPIEEFVELAKDRPVDVLMSYCPMIDWPRGSAVSHRPDQEPVIAGVPWNALNPAYMITAEMWHAGAQMAYAKGLDGLSTFNLNPAEFAEGYDLNFLNEIADPNTVAGHDKLYPFITGESANRSHLLGAEPVNFDLYVADTPADIESMILEVHIDEVTHRDRLGFTLNGEILPMKLRTCAAGGVTSIGYGPKRHRFFAVELTQLRVQTGPAQLGIRVVQRNPQLASPLMVRGVNIRVRGRGNLPGRE
jgi:hypothetical protein